MRKLLLVLLSLPMFVMATFNFPATALAACDGDLLGIPTWHKYLDKGPEPDCEITGPKDGDKIDWRAASGRVALAVLEILIRIGTLISVGFVIYGGFRYITSQGEPENTKSASQTILNAVIGLVIALIATASVGFIATRLT